jgi:hypothetical protein
VLDEGVDMKRLALESAENHHFEGAGEEIALLGFFQGRLPKECGGCVLQCLEQNSVDGFDCQAAFLLLMGPCDAEDQDEWCDSATKHFSVR